MARIFKHRPSAVSCPSLRHFASNALSSDALIASEHLKDVHCPQRLCPTCLKNFHKSEKKYQEHMSLIQCDKRDYVPLDQPEPLSSEQEAVLVKSFDIGTSEEDKWRGYYHVLFPDDERYASLSPCKYSSLPSPESSDFPNRFRLSSTPTTYEQTQSCQSSSARNVSERIPDPANAFN